MRRSIVTGLAVLVACASALSAAAGEATDPCARRLLEAVADRIGDGVRCDKETDLADRLECRRRVGKRFQRVLERRGDACVDPATIAAMENDATLLASQLAASVRKGVGRLMSPAGNWNTEIVMDLSVTGAGWSATPPDVAACRALGSCPANIMITRCVTELDSTPAYVTNCAAAPESGFAIPPYTVDPDLGALTQLDAYTWSVTGDAGTSFGPFPFEVRYTLGPAGNSLTGIGVVDGTLWTFFVTGERVP
jgi:hypothetical protein